MPAGTPPLPETVALNVTFMPVPTCGEDVLSVVALATGAPTTVNEKEAVAVAGGLSESAT